LVVEMQNKNGDPKFSLQIGKNAQHGDGIRATGNPQSDPVTRTNHGVPGNGVADAFM
jgi:hypothetical protein